VERKAEGKANPRKDKVDVNQETVNQQRPARMVGYSETENSRPSLKNRMFSLIEPSFHGLGRVSL